MNTKILREVSKRIQQFPESVDMDNWVRKPDVRQETPCGTVCCIAGHVLELALGTEEAQAIADHTSAMVKSNDGLLSTWDYPTVHKAATILGIDKDQAQRLFFTEVWPQEFFDAYYGKNVEFHQKTPKMRADATADRIKHFIKTEGAE